MESTVTSKWIEVALRSIGIIGSRLLSYEAADHVGNVVEDALERGFHLASGGAIGADQFVIERLIDASRSFGVLHRVFGLEKI